MTDKGIAHIGIGYGSGDGDGQIVEAMMDAMKSPLLETTVAGASDIIVNFSGDVGLIEVNEAISCLTEVAGYDANIIFGTVQSDSDDDGVRVTIVATGLESAKEEKKKSMLDEYVNATYTGQPIKQNVQPEVVPTTQQVQRPTQQAAAAPETQTFSSPSFAQKEPENKGITIPEFLLTRK